MSNANNVEGYFVTYRNTGGGNLERAHLELRSMSIHVVYNTNHLEAISTVPSRLQNLPALLHGLKKGKLREIRSRK
ncbi:MAG: hypothetical protein K2W95_24850 [Candidatus Obscuribacterales bacterium]|nr:hypothetical protein [Candidatus Obscuribacterales bacterium]